MTRRRYSMASIAATTIQAIGIWLRFYALLTLFLIAIVVAIYSCTAR